MDGARSGCRTAFYDGQGSAFAGFGVECVVDPMGGGVEQKGGKRKGRNQIRKALARRHKLHRDPGTRTKGMVREARGDFKQLRKGRTPSGFSGGDAFAKEKVNLDDEKQRG